MYIVAIVVGILLAIAIGLMGTRFGLDRDRALYPIMMIVIASYYVLFAIMGGSTHALVLELLVCAVFLVFAISGFRLSLWIVVIALAVHGFFDLIHANIIFNQGVPSWWPEFCLSFDVTFAFYLVWMLKRGYIRTAA